MGRGAELDFPQRIFVTANSSLDVLHSSQPAWAVALSVFVPIT